MPQSSATTAVRRPAGAAARIAWCFYDWANSPFIAVIVTFVISAYFVEAVATGGATTEAAKEAARAKASSDWLFMQGLAAGIIAVLSPVTGAIADRGGRRKPWLGVLTVIVAAGAFAIWWVRPQPGDSALLLWSVGIAVIAFEMSMVFYNAMLPGIVSEAWMGRLSGWAWALGYAGGLACLLLVLYGFIKAEPPPLGLDRASDEHIRAVGPIVAVWMLVFALPLFLFVPDMGGPRRRFGIAVREGVAQLFHTILEVRRYREVVKFLVARLLFMDGINTLFVFGGPFAIAAFGMTISEVAFFGLLLNVTAGIGAFGFGWMDDKLGAKPTVLLGVFGILALGVPLLLITDKLWFYILGGLIGMFFGPVQAAARSLMARMAPAGMETEMFGLYAFSGKATAFIGPLAVAAVIEATGSQRWGMATVLPFIVAGGALLLFVRTAKVDKDSVLG
jgi:UMF1 family MFS transporter